MTADEFFAMLDRVRTRRESTPEWVSAVVETMARSDVEVGQTVDQWLLAQSLGRYQIQLTRFFAFGEPDEYDINDVGISIFLSRPTDDLDVEADVRFGASDAVRERLPASEWTRIVRTALLGDGEPAIRRAEVFGGPDA